MKTKTHLLAILFIALIFNACQTAQESKTDTAPLIGPEKVTTDTPLLTPELMWKLGRVSDIQISPVNGDILFGVTWYDLAQNKGNRELYTMKPDGSGQTRITFTPFSEYDARWTPEGKITFVSTETGLPQLWEMDSQGKNRRQLSDIKSGLNAYRFAPDGSYVLIAADVPKPRVNEKLFEGLDKTTGRLMNDLMYRHWDSWVDAYSHLFVARVENGKITDPKDIMKDEPWESPVRPFGGIEQTAISPDGKTIAYTSRKKTGKAYAISTNTDIYLYSVETGETTNLTEGMMGYDMEPVFSPDGKSIAWWSMERDGYEADQQRLFTASLETGERTCASRGFDADVSHITWSADGSAIYFLADVKGTYQIFRYETASGTIRQITTGPHDFKSVTEAGGKLFATRVSQQKPDEIYTVDPETGSMQELSFINKALLDQINMGKSEERWIKTTDGRMMHTWVVFPPDFDSTKSYPTLLFCPGGPQNAVTQFWSYRWNFQLMAAKGYIVVAPNRRGVPGFGQAWKEQISGDYGGQNMKDYLSAIDAIASEPWSDENRLAAVGASYGGFSVFWLAGHHQKRFKAFIAHDGMFNLEAQYLETEEVWFADWDLGGPFWDKSNAVAQRSFASSPHRFVDKWDTPILVIHGELDYRIVASQGMSAFNAATLRGIPAQYLYFPNENHWVLKPQNAVLWQRVYFDWLEKWL